jgi:hypothetical protein
VGVVVLHADEVDAVELDRVLGRQVLGVQVVGDDGRLDLEQPPQVVDGTRERPVGLPVLQVADVVRQVGACS